MSLVKSPRMTEKKVTANERNRKLAHGPVTDEGRERIRAAHWRHGFYAREEEVALRALGEDPAQFQELLAGLWEEHNPAGASQEGLVIRLARATWLLNRLDRTQEGYAVRLAQGVNIGRQDRLHVQMMRQKMMVKRLELLAQSVAREHYVTTPQDLEKMKNLHQEGVLKELGEIALALFCQLQAPGVGEDGLDEWEKARRVVAQVKEIFGIGMSAESTPQARLAAAPGQPQESPHEEGAPEEEEENGRHRAITVAEWDAREQPRQLLENILRRQAEICEARAKALLRESIKGPSPYERAAEIAPTHANAMLIRRMQDSYFREVRRVTNLLLKMKRNQPEPEGTEVGDENDGGVGLKVGIA